MQAIIGRLKQNAVSSQLASGTHVLRRSRLQWWPVTMVSFLTGAALSGLGYDTVFFLGLAYFSLPYNLLRFGGNDVFDCMTSQQTARQVDERRGMLSKDMLAGSVFWILAVQAAVLVPLALQVAPAARLWLLALVLVSLAYSAPFVRFKETPLFDILSFGCFIGGPLIFANLAAGYDMASDSTVLLAAGGVGLWAVATHLFGSIQDIDLDRLGWIRSTARVLGSRAATVISTLIYLGLAGYLLFSYSGTAQWLALVPFLYALNTLRFINVANPELSAVGWRVLCKLNVVAAVVLAAAVLLST